MIGHMFTAEANDIILASVQFDPSGGTTVALFDADNNFMYGTESRVNGVYTEYWIIPNTGSYGLWLNLHSTDRTTEYQLTIDKLTASEISLDTMTSDELTTRQPVSLYGFEIEERTLVGFEVASPSFIPNVQLLTAATDEPLSVTAWLIDLCDDAPPDQPITCAGSTMLLEPGRYSLLIPSMHGNTGQFTVEITSLAVTPMVLDTPVLLTLTDEADAAYAYFFNAQNGLYDIRVIAQDPVDTSLSLLTQGGSRRATDDDSGQGTNPEITRFHLPDQAPYVVRVSPQLAGQTGQVIVLLERNEAAQLDDGPKSVIVGESDVLFSFFAQEGEQLKVSFTLNEGLNMPALAVEGTQQLVYLPPSSVQAIDVDFEAPFSGTFLVRVYATHPVEVGVVEVELTRLSDEDN